MNFILNYFKEPKAAEPIQDQTKVKELYKKSRIDIWVACFVGYTFFHLCKKNIAVALPGMGESLGYSNMQLGILGSALYFTYAFGKFINGVLADRSDAKKFFSAALFMSALCNILFGLSPFLFAGKSFSVFGLSSNVILLFLLAFFWGINGWFQSMGFPAIAKSLTYWFSNTERGNKWALWSTSHQLGVALASLVTPIIIKFFGWQAAFIVPGIINILVSIYLFKSMKDKPASVGLPDIELYSGDKKVTEETPVQDEEENASYLQIFKKYILFNRTMWLLAIAYVFVYIIRFGTEDWIIKYLVDYRNYKIDIASVNLLYLSLCGVVGVISAGFLSDKVFKGKRTPVNIIYLLCLGACIFALMFTRGELSGLVMFKESLLIAGIGFFTAGPQMLIGGLCAVESSSKKVASAACGFTGIFGYVGAFLSSTGTGYCVDRFGWHGALTFWGIAAFICVMICLVLLNADKQKA